MDLQRQQACTVTGQGQDDHDDQHGADAIALFVDDSCHRVRVYLPDTLLIITSALACDNMQVLNSRKARI